MAGAVYTEAVSSGVPADLAKTFAAEVWDVETAAPEPSTAEGDEEDD
jgi:hypothetical protein